MVTDHNFLRVLESPHALPRQPVEAEPFVQLTPSTLDAYLSRKGRQKYVAGARDALQALSTRLPEALREQLASLFSDLENELVATELGV